MAGTHPGLRALCRIIVIAGTLTGSPVRAHDAPNIVVIYADDLGYGDVQCYNPDRGKIPTPHLDRLASEGMRFTDAHSSSGVCSPSRYTLLTGRYHWRSRLQRGIIGTWEQPLITADRVTIGTLAKEHGYRTACIGKWHLGWDWPLEPGDKPLLAQNVKGQPRPGPADVTPAHRAAWQRIFSQPVGGGPTARGFDVYFGPDVPNWPPYCFIEQDRTVGIPTTLLPAEDFTHHRASTQGPALEDWRLEAVLPALRDRAVGFIEESAARPEPFLLYLPLTSPHTPLAVNEPWRGRSGLDNACADLIMETDAVVGDVLAAIEKAGVDDDTLVVFTSDNGFAPYVGAKDLEAHGHYPSGPLRGYKSDAWEGGHRVPFIVRWPGTLKGGSVCDALVHQADVMATCADVFGTPLPDTIGEDSVSLMPLLKGEAGSVREHAVSCSANGVPAVRLGSWKYIAAPGSGGWSTVGDTSQPVQLYDLATDLGETKNLAATEPERVAQMQALLERLIGDGRSTPGTPQKNDVDVVRHPRPTTASPTAAPPEAGSAAETDRSLGWRFTPDPSLPADPVQADVDTYAAHLRTLAAKLEATGARLIFATTTPVQPGTTKPLREPDAPVRHNAAAMVIMSDRGIRVNDLFSFCMPQLERLQLPKNVHFTAPGSKALAAEVARVIEEELARK